MVSIESDSKFEMPWTLSSQTGRDMHPGVFVEAICPHGVGHHKGVHGCDGCCATWPKEIADRVTKDKSTNSEHKET
jgi:hypothetical protein